MSQTSTESRGGSRNRSTTEAAEQANNNGSNGQAEQTERAVRDSQQQYAEAQQKLRDTAQQQAAVVNQQLQQAGETGREAVGEYVRGISRSFQAFVPQAVVDPAQVIDLTHDLVVQYVELQRSFLKELVSAGRSTTDAVSNATTR